MRYIARVDDFDGIGELNNLRRKIYQQARDIVPLERWGYVCTMNRPQSDSHSQRSNYSTLISQSQDEVQFFQEHYMSDLLDEHMAGCK